MSKQELEDAGNSSIESEGPGASGFLLSSFQAFSTLLRPYAPQIVPLVVCLCFIPLILAVSGFAGYVVWSSLSAQWEAPLYLQYGDGMSPYAQVAIPNLHSQQRYDVSLHLRVPATEANFQLGNFMTALTLTTTSNITLATIRRPAIVVVPKASWLFRTPSVVDIHIPLVSTFVSGTSSILAKVQIGRADDWRGLGNGESRELSVSSASLQGLAVPHGIRGIAIRFPLLSSLTAAFTFLTILTVILGTCILPIMLPSQSIDGLDGAEQPKRRTASNSIAFPSYDLKVRKKRKSHVRRSTSDGSGIKQEESFPMIPPADEPGPERLRQRRTSTKRESQDDLDS